MNARFKGLKTLEGQPKLSSFSSQGIEPYFLVFSMRGDLNFKILSGWNENQWRFVAGVCLILLGV